MKKYPHFEFDEFIRSTVAKRKNIENIPTFEYIDNLNELIETILEPLRAAYGMPITISSGYRCEKLNKAVGGVPTSVHQKGLAADLTVGGSFNKFRDFVVEWAKKNRIKFDQILLESSGGTRWIHIGLRNNAGQQRGEIKVINL